MSPIVSRFSAPFLVTIGPRGGDGEVRRLASRPVIWRLQRGGRGSGRVSVAPLPLPSGFFDGHTLLLESYGASFSPLRS